LSRLAAEVVDYVLEVAAIHLEDGSTPYLTTVGAIATCMGKTPRQLTPTLQHLFLDGYITGDGPIANGKSIHVRQRVYPTAKALRMLPYFRELPEDVVNAELAKLRVV
jgi:hypothetical protein